MLLDAGSFVLVVACWLLDVSCDCCCVLLFVALLFYYLVDVGVLCCWCCVFVGLSACVFGMCVCCLSFV